MKSLIRGQQVFALCFGCYFESYPGVPLLKISQVTAFQNHFKNCPVIKFNSGTPTWCPVIKFNSGTPPRFHFNNRTPLLFQRSVLLLKWTFWLSGSADLANLGGGRLGHDPWPAGSPATVAGFHWGAQLGIRTWPALSQIWRFLRWAS